MPERCTCRIYLSRVPAPNMVEKHMLGMLEKLSGDGPHSSTQLCQGACLLPTPLHLSGSSEGGQNEHSAGPDLQDGPSSHGTLFPGLWCCVMALVYCFLLFNFPSPSSSVVWGSYMQNSNSSVLVMYLAMSSKEDRSPFHHTPVQHTRERLMGRVHIW